MRKAPKAVDGVSIKAYAGTSGVLLAMNVNAKAQKGLLGFAIHRTRKSDGAKKWLPSMLHFAGTGVPPGAILPSNESPIQKFRWSDYTVDPDAEYEYEIHPAYGEAAKLRLGDGPVVKIATHGPDDDHFAIFNRAAAASQAFQREFPFFVKKPGELPDDVRAWLSRGVEEQILSFIDHAKNASWALDIAIYEYELETIRRAVAEAAKRKVAVRIVYHAKAKDEQTEVNEASLRSPRLPKEVEKYARLTSKIMHDKFIVLSKLRGEEREPTAVLCGSTNFTENGVFRQANVVHVARHKGMASTYLKLFEQLVETHEETSATKKWITENNTISETKTPFVGFSPRSQPTDLDEFIRIIDGAERDVLFSTAFKLDDRIVAALRGAKNDPILRFGLQNASGRITGTHADKTCEFVAAALVPSGIEGWIKETTAGQKGNILIHTKLVVVDFTSDAPTVISGSHNLSKGASGGNDENYLIFRGNRDIADMYGCELLRLYDHYRFRFRLKGKKKTTSKKKKVMHLEDTDCWTDAYFKKGDMKCADRMKFSGT